jgi:hypothetical protein
VSLNLLSKKNPFESHANSLTDPNEVSKEVPGNVRRSYLPESYFSSTGDQLGIRGSFIEDEIKNPQEDIRPPWRLHITIFW